MDIQQLSGTLCVVSGPSGSGKTTLCHKMVSQGGCAFSVSCTTRPPREGETDGKDYYFLSSEDFEAKITAGDFLEHARVHDHLYGTLKSSVIKFLQQGIDVLMDIDVQGAELIRRCDDESIQLARTDIFILPPSIAELEARLQGRGTETTEHLRLRMQNAVKEMDSWPAYDYTLISGTPEEDFARFSTIIHAERMRSSRRFTEEQS